MKFIIELEVEVPDGLTAQDKTRVASAAVEAADERISDGLPGATVHRWNLRGAAPTT